MRISEEQAIGIAKEFFCSSRNLIIIESINAHLEKENNVWIVSFAIDHQFDPDIFFIEVDCKTGKPRHFHSF